MSSQPAAQDRRIQRTRETLRVGLLELMKQKPFQQISVQELTRACNLNRSTFYLHYASVAELLEEMEQEILQGLCSVLDRFEQHAPCSPESVISADAAMIEAFQFLADYHDFFRTIVESHGNSGFVQRVMDIVRNRCLGIWARSLCTSPSYLSDYFLTFILSGCFGVVEQWITTDMKQSPQEIAQLVNRFILTGASSFFNQR